MYWTYPILPLGIVACTFFPTTFLEIAVCWANSSVGVVLWKHGLQFLSKWAGPLVSAEEVDFKMSSKEIEGWYYNVIKTSTYVELNCRWFFYSHQKMYVKYCQLQSPAKVPRQGKGGAEGKHQVNRNPVLIWYMKINTVAALFIVCPVCLQHFS